MPNTECPENPVLIRDYLSKLNLPAGKDIYACFKFQEFGPCSTIDRVVLGMGRDAVEKYHKDHPEVEKAPTYSGTSDFGFGPVIVLGADGSLTEHPEMLIFITHKEPDRKAPGRYAAQKVSIAEVAEELPKEEQLQAEEAQASCYSKLSEPDQLRLRARVRTT